MNAKLFLVTLSGEYKNFIITVKNSVVIGKRQNCDIQLCIKGISGEHSRIKKEENIFILQDLNSTNGTYVNDKKISNDCELVHGDKVAIASQKFFVWIGDCLPLLFSKNDNQIYVIYTSPFTAGRTRDNNLYFSDTKASGKHAIFTKISEKYQLKDLGSTNGTKVNGAKINECLLSHFDAIKMGEWESIFLDKPSPSTLYLQPISEGMTATVIDNNVTFGKSKSNDIIVNSPSVSKKHGRIFFDCGHAWIEDLNSRNGVNVNDAKIIKYPLQDDDIIKIGAEIFRIQYQLKKLEKLSENQLEKSPEKQEELGKFYLESAKEEKIYITEKSAFVGRKQSCQICLQDSEISNIHAELIWKNDAFVIHDKDSRNGLYVNGKKIKSGTLHHNDKICFGKTCFLLQNAEILDNSPKHRYALIPENQYDNPIYITTHLSIGRDPSNHLVLKNENISLQHAYIYSEGGEYFIKDTKSSSGVFANDIRINNHALSHGDKITISKQTFIFKDINEKLVVQNIIQPKKKFISQFVAGIITISFLLFFAHSLLFSNISPETIEPDDLQSDEPKQKRNFKISDKSLIQNALAKAHDQNKIYRYDQAIFLLRNCQKKIQILSNKRNIEKYISYFVIRKKLFDEVNQLLAIATYDTPVRLYIPGKGICSIQGIEKENFQLILENRKQQIFSHQWRKISPKIYLYMIDQLALNEKYSVILTEMCQEFVFPEKCEEYAILALQQFPKEKEKIFTIFAKMLKREVPKNGFIVYKNRLVAWEKKQEQVKEIRRKKEKEKELLNRKQQKENQRKAIEIAIQKENEEFPIRYAIINEFAQTYSYRKAQEQFAKLLKQTTISSFRNKLKKRMAELEPLAKLFDKLISSINKKKLKDNAVQIGDVRGIISNASDRYFQITIPNGEIRQRWYYLSPLKVYDFFARMNYDYQDLFQIGVFCFENELLLQGNSTFINFITEYPRERKLVDLYLSVKFKVPIPKGGFVPYQGTLISPEARKNLSKGLVRYGEKWVTPGEKEKYEQGFLKHKGKWITLDEGRLIAKGYSKYKGKWYSRQEINNIRSNWEDAWTLSTDHYDIKSNISEEFLQEFGGLMEKAYQTYKTFFGNVEAKKRMTLYAFKGYEDYRKFCIEIGQQNSLRAGGFAISSMNVGVGWRRNKNSELINTMIHEGGHLYQFNVYPRSSSPSWLSEATATQFEGYTWNKETKELLFNFVSRQRLSWIKRNILKKDYFSIPDLIQGRAINFINSDPQKAMTFYSQNWALYYFFTHTKEEIYRTKFQEFLKRVHSGLIRGGEATLFLQLFDGELDKIETLWTKLISSL